MAEQLNADVIEAAGGIVERPTGDRPLIAVIHRERYGSEWVLPKGKREPGESWRVTALREVAEETGLSPEIVGIAGATAYLARGVPKLVLFWRMRTEADPPPFARNDEATALEWLTPREAIERLSHREEAELVARLFGERGVLV